jgi:hypothetical protein
MNKSSLKESRRQDVHRLPRSKCRVLASALPVRAYHTHSADRNVDLDRQVFPRVVIHDVQGTTPPPRAERIGHKAYRHTRAVEAGRPQQLAVPSPGWNCSVVSCELLQSWSGARGLKRRPLAHTPMPAAKQGTRGEQKPEKVLLSLD